MAFTLPNLPYAYDSLEPYIDARTMEIHHDLHHAAYTKKLNAAIEGTDLVNKDIVDILRNLDMKNLPIRNNGGGYFNHNLFWVVMTPNSTKEPIGSIAKAINNKFGSYESFKNEFSNAAKTQFGSGWAWLCVHPGGKLDICQTANQDNPLMPGIGCGGFPILGLDVWEHAYYLQYQNKRPDYVDNFFNVINWEQVNKYFEDHK